MRTRRGQRRGVSSVQPHARDGVDLPAAGHQVLDAPLLLGDETRQQGATATDDFLAGQPRARDLGFGHDDDEHHAMATIGRIDVGSRDGEGVEERIVFDRCRLVLVVFDVVDPSALDHTTATLAGPRAARLDRRRHSLDRGRRAADAR